MLDVIHQFDSTIKFIFISVLFILVLLVSNFCFSFQVIFIFYIA